MDATLKVLKRLTTKVGEYWPIGSYVCVDYGTHYHWYLITARDDENRIRESDELSECEANYFGIFRKK